MTGSHDAAGAYALLSSHQVPHEEIMSALTLAYERGPQPVPVAPARTLTVAPVCWTGSYQTARWTIRA